MSTQPNDGGPAFPLLTTLLYLSYIPTAPFYLLAWTCFGLGWVINAIGDIINDKTTYRIWSVRHRKQCAHYFAARTPTPAALPGKDGAEGNK